MTAASCQRVPGHHISRPRPLGWRRSDRSTLAPPPTSDGPPRRAALAPADRRALVAFKLSRRSERTASAITTAIWSRLVFAARDRVGADPSTGTPQRPALLRLRSCGEQLAGIRRPAGRRRVVELEQCEPSPSLCRRRRACRTFRCRSRRRWSGRRATSRTRSARGPGRGPGSCRRPRPGAARPSSPPQRRTRPSRPSATTTGAHRPSSAAGGGCRRCWRSRCQAWPPSRRPDGARTRPGCRPARGSG